MSYMAAFGRFMRFTRALRRGLFHVGDLPTSGGYSYPSRASEPSLPFRVVRFLLAGAALSISLVNAQEPNELRSSGHAITWNLSSIMVNSGRAETLIEGKFAHDIFPEATATGINPATPRIAAGTFRPERLAFSPASNQRGQFKGVWHVLGRWILTDANATEAGNGRPPTGVISDESSAEPVSNPLIKKWTAKIRLPSQELRRADGKQSAAREDRALMVYDKYEGSISLNLKLQPLVQNQKFNNYQGSGDYRANT